MPVLVSVRGFVHGDFFCVLQTMFVSSARRKNSVFFKITYFTSLVISKAEVFCRDNEFDR